MKSLATALVCGIFFISYASAQEVFVGEQQATPKYPKAEPAVNHAKTTAQAAKPASKPASVAAPKSASAVKVASEQKPTAVAKAVPVVAPGQRAPSATPSPIVRPQAPMLAKSQAPSAKLPAAAVPPPSKSLAAAKSFAEAQAILSAANKSPKTADKPAVTQTKAPAPPAEGPTHDVVMRVEETGRDDSTGEDDEARSLANPAVPFP